ncbi:MAG: beta-ketodecanoyl-[acyl-carrier-protein] synthase [Saprospiraceae bacterium]|jgi:beta-ketodecanoyl-[acyl-carrier-protein] synthase
MSMKVVISGTGLFTPKYTLSNEELVACYNEHADEFNASHSTEIESGTVIAKPHSSAAFIEKASGIKQRYIYQKEGVLDLKRMRPSIPKRNPDEISDQAEMAIASAKEAMAAAQKEAKDIDAVIVSCAYTQRSYPAIAIEVQSALGINGFGFDMLVACSAATFALQRAYEMIKAGTAKCVLVINPELTSPQVNYKDRDSHFIFGDVSMASIVEGEETVTSSDTYEILSTKALTQYSNNIRSNFGYVLNCNDADPLDDDQYFSQNGRTVYKEVCPLAAKHIAEHLSDVSLSIDDIKRWWLHQANINMNKLICSLLLDRQPSEEEAPIVLDEFANTASAGSLIAFHRHHKDLSTGDLGVICSFGAGYSIGSLIVKKS